MELNKTTKRLIAARRPFSVVEIKDDPRITNVNGKQSAYNIVGKNGSGIAEFGCDELAALWFCEAANRYADEIYNRRSMRNCDRFGGDYKMLHTAWFDRASSPSGQNPDGTVKLTFAKWLLSPATEKEGGAK